VQQSKFTEVCDYAWALYRQLRLQPWDDNDFWSTVAIEIMLRTIIRFKDPKFREEEEWRMLRFSGEYHTPNIRQSPRGDIPYVKVPLDPDALARILLGSRTTDAEVKSVGAILANAGLAHVPIQRSSITCRAALHIAAPIPRPSSTSSHEQGRADCSRKATSSS